MYQLINRNMFIEAFSTFDGRYDQMGGYEGLSALFNYLEDEVDPSGHYGVGVQLDVIALCCQFSEYASIEEIIESMGLSFEDDETEEAMEWLQDHTSVIQFDTGIIIENY